MDNVIIMGFLFLDWILFLFFHVVLLRLGSYKDVFKSLSYSILLPVPSGMIICGIFYYISYLPLASFLSNYLISLLLFFISSPIYILGVFGIAESSIRIRILTTIGKAREKGMTEKELLTSYNTQIIVHKRIDRFLHSGELIKKNGNISRGRGGSLALLPAFIFHIFWIVYRNDAWYKKPQ